MVESTVVFFWLVAKLSWSEKKHKSWAFSFFDHFQFDYFKNGLGALLLTDCNHFQIRKYWSFHFPQIWHFQISSWCLFLDLFPNFVSSWNWKFWSSWKCTFFDKESMTKNFVSRITFVLVTLSAKDTKDEDRSWSSSSSYSSSSSS